jgi:hypothetical protein
MPRITLSIDIDIKNYREIARTNSGPWAGRLANTPILGWIVQSKINAEIEKKIGKSAMGNKVAEGLRRELENRGVNATVTHSLD